VRELEKDQRIKEKESHGEFTSYFNAS